MEVQQQKNMLIIGAGNKVVNEIIDYKKFINYKFIGLTSQTHLLKNNNNKINFYHYNDDISHLNLEFHNVIIISSRVPSLGGDKKDFFKVNNVVQSILLKNNYHKKCRISLFSTFSVYNSLVENVKNDSKIEPQNHYGNAKYSLEEFVIDLCKSKNIYYIIYRLPVFLYSGVQSNFIAKIRNSIMNKDEIILSNPDAFLSAVFDIYTLLELESYDLIKNRTFNCGALGDITFNEISKLAMFYGGNKVTWVESKRPSANVNIEQIIEILGYAPSAKLIIERWFKEEFQK